MNQKQCKFLQLFVYRFYNFLFIVFTTFSNGQNPRPSVECNVLTAFGREALPPTSSAAMSWRPWEEQIFQCQYCKKICLHRGHLNEHLRVHTKAKPFSCAWLDPGLALCSKKFATTGALKVHMRTHTGLKPYSCSVCLQKFSQSGNLDTHMKTHS